MRLSQFGFSLLVIVYLAPLLGIDFYSNTMSTGAESDLAYFKAIFDGLLLGFAIYQGFFRGPTASVSDARAGGSSRDDRSG